MKWIAALLFALSVPTGVLADAMMIHFTGTTCTICWGQQNLPQVNIDANIAADSRVATVWEPVYQIYVTMSVLVVTGITGQFSINCGTAPVCSSPGSHVMSFAAPDVHGDSYFWPNRLPRYIRFSTDADFSEGRIFNDNAVELFSWTTQVPISFTADVVAVNPSSTPEPRVAGLLMTGAVALALLRRSRVGG
jgi:hypothetical protein